MTVRFPTLMLALVTIAALAVSTGCGSSPKTNFYVLDSTAERAPITTDLRIGIGPVTLPPYLDRTAIVSRSSGTTIDVADFDLWAEPLEGAFARTLAEDISRLFGTEAVFVHPWGTTMKVIFRVPVRVIRFDSSPNGDATLVALWRILDDQQMELVGPQRSVISIDATDAAFPASATALSHAITTLSKEIAAAVPDAFKGWKADYDPSR